MPIKTIRTNNGLECLSNSQNLLSNLGILHQKPCTYSPQQNGVVERKHRHLLQITMSLLYQSKLRKRFWGEALLHATFLTNILPTKALS